MVKESIEFLGPLLTETEKISFNEWNLSIHLKTCNSPTRTPKKKLPEAKDFLWPSLSKLKTSSSALLAVSIMDSFHSGFRPGHGTKTSLLALVCDFLLVILLAPSVVSGSTGQQILLSCLHQALGMNVNAQNWLRALLSDWIQIVIMSNCSYTSKVLISSIPQTQCSPLLVLVNEAIGTIGQTMWAEVLAIRSWQAALHLLYIKRKHNLPTFSVPHWHQHLDEGHLPKAKPRQDWGKADRKREPLWRTGLCHIP